MTADNWHYPSIATTTARVYHDRNDVTRRYSPGVMLVIIDHNFGEGVTVTRVMSSPSRMPYGVGHLHKHHISSHPSLHGLNPANGGRSVGCWCTGITQFFSSRAQRVNLSPLVLKTLSHTSCAHTTVWYYWAEHASCTQVDTMQYRVSYDQSWKPTHFCVFVCVLGGYIYNFNTVMWEMRVIPFDHCCMLPGADATQQRLKQFNMKRNF